MINGLKLKHVKSMHDTSVQGMNNGAAWPTHHMDIMQIWLSHLESLKNTRQCVPVVMQVVAGIGFVSP